MAAITTVGSGAPLGERPGRTRRQVPGEADLSGLPALPPRASTAEQAASVLREQIATGRLVPGTRLREEHLAESFAISRNTIREVLRILAHERLVEHVPYKGVRIRRLEQRDVAALYLTRRLVEPLGLRVAFSSPQLRETLRRVVDEADRAAATGDWHQVGTADIAFHRALVHGCGSNHLNSMFEKLLAELRLAFLQLPDPEQLHHPYLERNRRLVALLEAGEQDATLAELDDYLDAAERDVLRQIDA